MGSGGASSTWVRLPLTRAVVAHADDALVSGQSNDVDKRRALDAGADGYYTKPLSMRTLDALVALHFP
jgi:DNA-binding response OmpR family regulator